MGNAHTKEFERLEQKIQMQEHTQSAQSVVGEPVSGVQNGSLGSSPLGPSSLGSLNHVPGCTKDSRGSCCISGALVGNEVICQETRA